MAENQKRGDKEVEARGAQKLPYPKSVFFIVGNEFCERFSYYGMKSILSIYLKRKLKFSEDNSTVIYHAFSMFCYFTPIFGAMIADQLLGKFRTIVYISLIYVLGHLLKTLAAVPTLGVPPVEFSLIGLALIAIGTGGIKPCVSAFGGDQFKLPEQERQLQTFFSIFYFSINAGSLISTVLTPWIREDVECFGDDTCYSLAFGIPALLMLVATIIIVVGRPLYTMKPPQGSVLTRCFGAVGYALRRKMSGAKADHWLDLAKDRYESRLVEDVKCVCRVLLMYLPLPVWWALFDQTGSRWTFQATRMDGVMGGTVVKPDQMQVINPLLILFLIPIFDKIIYPAFARCNLLVKPLQRMTAGGVLTAASFIISGLLELEMMKTYAKVPVMGVSHVNVMNTLPCHVLLQLHNDTGMVHEMRLGAGLGHVMYDVAPNIYNLKMEPTAGDCDLGAGLTFDPLKLTTSDAKVSAVHLGYSNDALFARQLEKFDDPKKDDNANAKIRVVYDNWADLEGLGGPDVSLVLVNEDLTVNIDLSEDNRQTNYTAIDVYGEYDVKLGSGNATLPAGSPSLGRVTVWQGGVYTIALSMSDSGLRSDQFTLTMANTIHIMWLIPQYLVITVGEVMFSVTGLEFSYSQAPDSMKSVLQAAWLLTVAFGNIIVIIVAKARAFDDQASEFFMFAVLMLVDMVLFAWLAWRYVPRQVKNNETKVETSGVNNNSFNTEVSEF